MLPRCSRRVSSATGPPSKGADATLDKTTSTKKGAPGGAAGQCVLSTRSRRLSRGGRAPDPWNVARRAIDRPAPGRHGLPPAALSRLAAELSAGEAVRTPPHPIADGGGP